MQYDSNFKISARHFVTQKKIQFMIYNHCKKLFEIVSIGMDACTKCIPYGFENIFEDFVVDLMVAVTMESRANGSIFQIYGRVVHNVHHSTLEKIIKKSWIRWSCDGNGDETTTSNPVVWNVCSKPLASCTIK